MDLTCPPQTATDTWRRIKNRRSRRNLRLEVMQELFCNTQEKSRFVRSEHPPVCLFFLSVGWSVGQSGCHNLHFHALFGALQIWLSL